DARPAGLIEGMPAAAYGRAGDVSGASGGGKSEGSRALAGGVTGATQSPFPHVNGGVAGTGFEPV
ncbi:MAG TPA: hypothetical protein VNK73_15675, partial [Actinomycetota bacterium]|nr:hypothetical protein [Actinomycetota bacterium]